MNLQSWELGHIIVHGPGGSFHGQECRSSATTQCLCLLTLVSSVPQNGWSSLPGDDGNSITLYQNPNPKVKHFSAFKPASAFFVFKSGKLKASRALSQNYGRTYDHCTIDSAIMRSIARPNYSTARSYNIALLCLSSAANPQISPKLGLRLNSRQLQAAVKER